MSSCRFSNTAAISLLLERPSVLSITLGSESIAQPSSAVPRTTSIATGQIALAASRPTFGSAMVDPSSSFMTPVRLAIASTPLSARITLTNCTQRTLRLSCRGSRKRVVRCGALMAINATTTITVGRASATARLPECFGPNQLIDPRSSRTATVVNPIWSFKNLSHKMSSAPAMT